MKLFHVRAARNDFSINADDVASQFTQALEAFGIELEAPVTADGVIHRVHVKGDSEESLNGWYVFHGHYGHYGSWKHDADKASHRWTAQPENTLSEADRNTLQIAQEALRGELAEAKLSQHEAARRNATRLWEAAEEDSTHPYLQAKKLTQAHGTRVYRDMLLVPMKSMEDELRTLIRIWPDGTKKLLAGGEKKGHFHSIGIATRTIYLAEGIATAASIHEATGQGTLCCGDAGNLIEVAKVLKESEAAGTFVIAGDSDEKGQKSAREAAEILACEFVIPDFTSLEAGPKDSDLNDLARLAGLDEVKRQLEHCRKASCAKIIRDLLKPSGLAYEQELKAQAKQLGVTKKALDKEVKKQRNQIKPTSKAQAVSYADAETVLTHQDPLELVDGAIKQLGYGGDTKLPKLLYLAFTTRLLSFGRGNMLANSQVVGQASSGKNYLVDTVLSLLPEHTYLKIDAGSPKTLIYCADELKHRIVVFTEADSLPISEGGGRSLADGDSRSTAASALRNLASDGYLSYDVVERDPDTGSFTTRHIRKDGPTLLITTTTKAITGQMGTRLWEIPMLETDAQLQKALAKRVAYEADRQIVVPHELVCFQDYLQSKAPWNVQVPFAKAIADGLVYKGMDPRILRDFERLLSLVKAAAIIRHAHRDRNSGGLLQADAADYAAVYDVLAESYSATVNQGLTLDVRSVLAALAEIKKTSPMPAGQDALVKHLGWHKSRVSRKVKLAVQHGWIINQQTKRGLPADLILGESLPEDRGMPKPETIHTHSITSRQKDCNTATAYCDGLSGVQQPCDSLATALQQPQDTATAPAEKPPSSCRAVAEQLQSSCRAVAEQLQATKPVSLGSCSVAAIPAGSNDVCATVESEDTALEILKHYQVSYRHIVNETEAREAVKHLLAQNKSLGLDIETTGLDPHQAVIRLIQIYDGNGLACVFDMARVPMDSLQPVWTKSFVAHNAVFEAKFLAKQGINPTIHCTKLMGRLATGRIRSLSLAALAQEFLGWSVDKTLQVSDWATPKLSEKQLTYAALDAVLTSKLAQKLNGKLAALSQVDAYQQLQALIPIIARQELAGVPFDTEAHSDLVRHWMDERNRAEKAIYKAIGDTSINIDSGPQLGTWLETQLPEDTLSTWPKTATGKLKTDKDSVKLYGDLPVVKPLLRYKHLNKRLSTYGRDYLSYVSPATQRLHPGYFIAGTRVGKFASSQPNMMQLPRDSGVRALIRAPEGRAIICADFGQLELRIAAELSQDEALLQAYREGQDVHTKTAAAIAGVPIDQVTKAQRQAAKACNFGLLYGQGAKGLSDYARASYGVDMSLEQAQQAREAFFKAYPGLRRWQQATDTQARRSLKVYSKAGRLRDFKLEGSEYKLTEALNTAVASSAADVLIASLIRLDKALTGIDAHLIAHVHDEILLEASKADSEQAKGILTTAMTEGFMAVFPDASTFGLVEAKAGQTWAEAK